jgi:hypothetical protein
VAQVVEALDRRVMAVVAMAAVVEEAAADGRFLGCRYGKA